MQRKTISAREIGIGLAFTSILVLVAAVIGTATTTQAQQNSSNPARVVFVCLHGSVKSQMAAAHFNRIAKERGLPVVGVSRGIAVDNAVPTGIRRGLAGDGLIPPSDVPVALTSEEATAAAKIFAFDEVPAEMRGPADVTYWSDVPPATKDYASARDAIVRHLEEVVSSMTPDH
jgi:protein-tyrosine-phosphatase